MLALRSTGAFLETNNTRNWDRDLNDIETVYLRTGGEFLVGEINNVIVAMGGLRLNDDGSAALYRSSGYKETHRAERDGIELLFMQKRIA